MLQNPGARALIYEKESILFEVRTFSCFVIDFILREWFPTGEETVPREE